MSSFEIQNALFREYGLKSLLCIPNFTPRQWFECDLMRVTPSGYRVEYEIKISRSDFKADFLKSRFFGMPRPVQKKHDLLAAGDPCGPSNFYFVVPKGLLAIEDIPTHAGWIECTERHGKWRTGYIAKPAPRLNKTKVSDAEIARARAYFYHRYWTIRGQSPAPVEPEEAVA